MIALEAIEVQSPCECADYLCRRVLGAALLQPDDVVHRETGEGGKFLSPQAEGAAIAARDDTGVVGRQPITPSPKQFPEPLGVRFHLSIITLSLHFLAGTSSPTVNEGAGQPQCALETSTAYRPVPRTSMKGSQMTAIHTLVMTGASRGIGRIAAELILASDPTIHLVVVAGGERGPALAAELRNGTYSVSSVSADLSSMSSVRRAATEIATELKDGQLPPLRGFVGNAGIQHTNALTTGADGLEATFTVNVLANHIFIRTLEQHFVPKSRITITVSDTHFGDFKHNMGMVPGPVWQAPEKLAKTSAFDKPSTTAAGRTAYSTSKLAAIYLVHEFARRLPQEIDVVSFNPGFVPGTGLVRNADPVSQFLMGRIMPIMALTPMATSRTAAGRDLANVVLGRTKAPTGSYIDRAKADRSSDESYDAAREAELWTVVEKLTTV